MSLDSLYRLSDIRLTDDSFEASLSFDPGHAVFKGHFPGQAIVPGVCLIHILRETARMISGKPMALASGKIVKFLHIIDPEIHVQCRLMATYASGEDNTLSLNASILYNDTTFLKFKGDFSIFATKQP